MSYYVSVSGRLVFRNKKAADHFVENFKAPCGRFVEPEEPCVVLLEAEHARNWRNQMPKIFRRFDILEGVVSVSGEDPDDRAIHRLEDGRWRTYHARTVFVDSKGNVLPDSAELDW